jgi:hypothetical protein
MSEKHKYLLIISCSKTKNTDAHLLPAWERYTGRVFRLLKNALIPPAQDSPIDLVIISAKYGFLRPDAPISCYDVQMTPDLAKQHQREVMAGVYDLILQHNYRSCFVLLEPEYISTLGSLELPNVHVEQTIDSRSLRKLEQWLMKAQR